jgi:Ni2+-binding GTPase involved in maturation of urease and hydrogenase
MKLIITGGFLGSGKTTAIVNACQHLMSQSVRVAVITNDQGDQQVDTAFVSGFGIPIEEVAGGCFCCKYDQFSERIGLLREAAPDFIFAEAVGSCTDLVATLAKPLADSHPDLRCVISVFVDGELMSAILEGRASFLHESVRYIFKKQLEEADLLVVNKKDRLTAAQIESVYSILAAEFPAKKIHFQDSDNIQDVQDWIRLLKEFPAVSERSSLDIDYNTYGAGEAELCWYDDVLTISSAFADAVMIGRRIIGNVFDRVQEDRLVVGHLKFLIRTADAQAKVSFTTTSTSADVNFKMNASEKADLVINARIQTSPDILRDLFSNSITLAERMFPCEVSSRKASVFRPGFPTPTFRIDNG